MDEVYQQPIQTTPYMSPMHQFGSSIVTLTNPENDLYKFELFLRNMHLDKDGNPIPSGKPLMNEDGITYTLGMVQSVASTNTILSNYSETDVPRMILDFLDAIRTNFMLNRINYDMTCANRDSIMNAIQNIAFSSMKRAFEEGDKRFWKGSVQEIKNYTENSGKGGIFSALNPWGRK